MKKRKPVKHAHRKAMIRQKLARGKYSHCQINKYCLIVNSCRNCHFIKRCYF